MVNRNFHCHTVSYSNKATVWGISWVSFLWSTSSLMVFSILPAYLVDELKITHTHIGIIEGLAISSSFASKFFSGILSDFYKKRKPLIVIGALLTAIIKPVFALCSGTSSVFLVRFGDRLSKGIRSAPSDALVADVSEAKLYASNFGLRQSLYILGEVAGAVLAMTIMLLSTNNYSLVFILSTIPAFLALFVLWFFVKPCPKTHPRFALDYSTHKISINDIKQFSPAFWWLITAFFFLMLGRFSEAFLTLKAKHVGWSIALLPIMLLVMNLVHAAIALPAGRYADKISRNHMLAFGMLLMVLAQTVLAFVNTITGVCAGILLVGVHMGTTQGLLKALVAQSTPPHLRGTAFSVLFAISGIAIFIGNTVAGSLSHNFGIHAPFLGGLFFTSISSAILYFAFFRQKAKSYSIFSIYNSN